MDYHTTDGNGITEISPTIDRMRAVLESLDNRDNDFEDVSLTHSSGWTLSAYPSGILTLEDLEEKEPLKYLKGIKRQKMLNLWILLSEGGIEDLLSYSWMEE